MTRREPCTVGSKELFFTFANTKLVAEIILLTVKVTFQPRTTLDAVHAWDCTVAGFSGPRGAHLTAATVIQHCPLATQATSALTVVALIWAIHRVLGAPSHSQVHRYQERGQQQEALHVSQLARAQLPAVAVFAGGKQPSKVVAELLPTRLWVLYTALPACFPVINFLNPAAALSSCQPLLF